MSNQKKISKIKRWARRSLWFIGVVLLVGIMARLSLKTGFVQNWVKNYAVSTVNEKLTSELSIDHLSGDLWKEIKISGIRLAGEDTLAEIDSVRMAYNIRDFLDGKIKFSQLVVHQPKINLRQQGKQWNFLDIIKESDQPSDAENREEFVFGVDNLVLSNGHISVRTDSLPVEPNFEINGLNISSSLGFENREFDIALRDLSCSIDQTQLDSPIKVQTSAKADNNQVTLEKLIIATGNSLIQSSGFASSRDSSVQLDLSASPVSWQDIAEYVRDIPIRRNVQVDLGLKGKPEQFELTLNMQAPGMESLNIASRFQWQSSLAVSQLQVKSGFIDPASLLSDTTLPTLQNLQAEFTGHVEIPDYQQGYGDVNFSADQISHGQYLLDKFSGTASIKNQSVVLNLKASRQEETLNSKILVDRIWTDLPSLSAEIEASHINPENWIQDSTYAGDLSFSSRISGRGWYPETRSWDYSLMFSEAEIGGRQVPGFTANGKFSTQDISIDAQINVRESVFRLIADLRGFDANPFYDYSLVARNLDLAKVAGMENFTTSLNGKISGRGTGFDPSSLQLTSAVQIDSSLVNGELIENLSANFSVRDTVAVVDSAAVQSTIAEGSFGGRMHLLRYYDSNNELALDLSLKDIKTLAPLVNADTIRAEGTITGKMNPVENENLKFTGSLDLSNIRYDTLFAAHGAKGSVKMLITQDPEYLVDIDLDSPSFYGIEIQNLYLMTEGVVENSQPNGRYELQFSSPNEGRIEQAGNYNFTTDSIAFHSTKFNIVSDYRTLGLENPFNLVIRGDSVRMDTMRVSSGDGAFLEMAVPIFSPAEQRGYVRGNSLNTAVVQSCLLGETYFEGLLSGQFEISRKDTNLDARGVLNLSELKYQEAEFDSLTIETQIQNERLNGLLALHKERQQLINGQGDLPFKLGDPETFPSTFFDQPVSGTLRMRDISLENFRSFFAEDALAGTTGILSFQGSLDGNAGDPKFNASASLKKATLSGVSVDSVTAGVEYRHSESLLSLQASVMSLRQKAAQINAQFPLFVDMKTFAVDYPQEGDSISADVKTNNFNLAAMNDFVDPRTVRGISGQLNGAAHITGRLGNLKTDGEMVLEKGAFRSLTAGIRVENIDSDITLASDQIRLNNFSARSGRGTLKASGFMQLDQLAPGKMDIKIDAQNFRAANTAEYSAIINLDARTQGTFRQPKITGNLSFISGFLQLRNFGEKSVETVELDSLEETDYSFSLYDSLSLDMDISFNRRFFIRNQRYLEMEVELDGQLDLLKDPGSDMQLFGTMTASSGYATPLGKRFDIEEGSVTFTGDPTNPTLMVRTQYQPPQNQEEIVIWYVIEGSVENPKFRYESQPPMELENIISYTLFGQPFYALDSWKQVIANSGKSTTAADVALDVLLDRVEALATKKLGIDVVKIDNARSGGETGTSITTGWYLNPKVFFAIQNIITGSTPDTSFLLEYLLQKNLKLIIRQGNGIRQGVDVRWNYEY